MDKTILNEVIEAEKEIQTCIELEQARLRDSVDQARREAEESVARAEREISETRDREAETARLEAEAQARRIGEDAKALAARLERLDDRMLTGIVVKRLPRILME